MLKGNSLKSVASSEDCSAVEVEPFMLIQPVVVYNDDDDDDDNYDYSDNDSDYDNYDDDNTYKMRYTKLHIALLHGRNIL